MGLFEFLFEDDKKDKKNDELNIFGLSKSEKDLVKKGEYSPWNFDTDDTEDEDDYYHEDED